jgi:hypothetical protein
MAYTPKLAPMPKLKKAIMIQKERSLRMIRRVPTLGASPRKVPPFPKRIKRMPERREAIPINVRTLCQEYHPKRISAKRGAAT